MSEEPTLEEKTMYNPNQTVGEQSTSNIFS